MTKIIKTKEEWLKILTPEEYAICREKGTELPYTGKYNDSNTPGTYTCKCCGAELFTSDAKFKSDCGWPSFNKTAQGKTITEQEDYTHGMARIEVTAPQTDSWEYP